MDRDFQIILKNSDLLNFICDLNCDLNMSKSGRKDVVNESVPRPIQSKSRNVRPFVCCLFVPSVGNWNRMDCQQNSSRPSFSSAVSSPQLPNSNECNLLSGEQFFLLVNCHLSF